MTSPAMDPAIDRPTDESPPVRVWRNARLATLAATLPSIGVVENGAVVTRGDRILYSGRQQQMQSSPGAEVIDCQDRWITPGLVDCHTHLVHGGYRARDFESRLKGATYEQI